MINVNNYIHSGSGGSGKDAQEEIVLSKDQIIMVSERPAKIKLDNDHLARYTGKFLHKNNNMLTMGVCVDTRREFEFKENDIICLAYVDIKSLYSVNVRIISVREAIEADGFEIKDMTAELNSLCKYNKYIIDVLPLSGPERHQRREFFRMPLSIDIYYKIIDANKIANITTSGDLKFEPEKAKETKKIADDGLLEKDGGYIKLTTVDLSAGGFRYQYQSGANIEAGTFLDCVIIINNEGLPAIAQVLSVKPPDEKYPDSSYDVRVLYYKMGDPVRDRIVRYIFAQQRKIQSKLFRRKF